MTTVGRVPLEVTSVMLLQRVMLLREQDMALVLALSAVSHRFFFAVVSKLYLIFSC